jgi:hypothetical protein
VSLDKVLIATNFSEHAVHGTNRAAARADQGVLSKAVLLHVTRESPIASMQRLLRRNSRVKKKAGVNRARQLEAVADAFRIRTGLMVDGRVENGNLGKAI